MKICITLDDVLRAKTKQFGKIYKKAFPEAKLEEIDLSSGDLKIAFGFETKEAFNEFLYIDYPFEIFGEAPVTEKMLDKKLNLWLIRQADENPDVSFMLSNPYEFNASIGYTYFFLSQIATRIREIYLPSNSKDIWNKCDVLITADKSLLDNKPEGKISIKIKTDYNTEEKADYEYDSLDAFLDDEEILKKLQGEN